MDMQNIENQIEELKSRLDAVDKKTARLNCIHHLLTQIPYDEVERRTVDLPQRERQQDYHRNPIPDDMYVPRVY